MNNNYKNGLKWLSCFFSMTYSYIIGSGWFSDEAGESFLGKSAKLHQTRYGGTVTRNTAFSKIWLQGILNLSGLPRKIFISDAASIDPLHEDVLKNTLVHVSPQLQNFGHSISCESQNILCGWARGVLHGAMYALVNSVDYFVYVEQDVLLVGSECVNKAIQHMNCVQKNICFGSGDETPQKLQQSFFIVKSSFLPTFISRLINYDNNRGTEENKYFACFQYDMTFLPFRGGRQRHNLDENTYYKQHMTAAELAIEIAKLGTI